MWRHDDNGENEHREGCISSDIVGPVHHRDSLVLAIDPHPDPCRGARGRNYLDSGSRRLAVEVDDLRERERGRERERVRGQGGQQVPLRPGALGRHGEAAVLLPRAGVRRPLVPLQLQVLGRAASWCRGCRSLQGRPARGVRGRALVCGRGRRVAGHPRALAGVPRRGRRQGAGRARDRGLGAVCRRIPCVVQRGEECIRRDSLR
mmetsp:Transcript_70687/g.191090  ORF Transcript_70687/g.191090 Transcript_70687/m.191090 type:complete len:205 (+) Transcript_70687:2414-3028(+)